MEGNFMSHIRKYKTSRGIGYILYDKVNGRWESKKLPVDNDKDAEKCRIKHEAEKMAGAIPAIFTAQVAFNEFLEKTYMPHSESFKSKVTFDRDKSHFKALVEVFGSVLISQINESLVSDFTALGVKKWSKKTVNNRLMCLSAVLRLAYERRLIPRMPKIKRLSLDILPPLAFDEHQTDLILSNAKGFAYDVAMLALHTGLRSAELSNLLWSDVNFEKKEITIRFSKNHRFRVIPISEQLFDHLQTMRVRNKINVLEITPGVKPYQGSLYKSLKRVLVSLKISGHLHACRHTVGSYLVRRDVPIYNVSVILGQGDLKTTMRYARLRTTDLVDSIEKLNYGNMQETSNDNDVIKFA